jgi:universal stress protein A
MKAIRTVLAPIDFSATSSLALEYATEMARRCEASLHLLHVVTDADVSPGTEAFWGFSEDAVQKKWVEEATTQLAALCLADEHAALRVVRAVEIGTPFVGIVRYARTHDIDLIVMGTHGRGAVQHLLLGSVAEQIVRQAPCPVLTVRSPNHTFETP